LTASAATHTLPAVAEDALFDAPTGSGPAGPRRLGGSLDEAAAPWAGPPLAVRMRPATPDGVVGQDHLLRPGSPLRQLVEQDTPMSIILWGPPGIGKTTLAFVVSRATHRRFVELSAVTAGVKEVRQVIEESRRALAATGQETV